MRITENALAAQTAAPPGPTIPLASLAYVYSPARVRSLLYRYGALSMSIERYGAIPVDAPPPGRRTSNYSAYDPLATADTIADLDRAHAQLPRWSATYTTVEHVKQGYTPMECDAARGLQPGTSQRALIRASELMARYLGWKGH